MLFVLPKKEDGIAKLVTTFDEKKLNEYQTKLHSERVDILLPKFKFSTGIDLSSKLKEMGMGIAFTNSSDFSGMSDTLLKINQAKQKAFIEVNEKGSEATAITLVGMVASGSRRHARPPSPKPFKADHPFLFFIMEKKTHAILFSGCVLDPTKEDN